MARIADTSSLVVSAVMMTSIVFTVGSTDPWSDRVAWYVSLAGIASSECNSPEQPCNNLLDVIAHAGTGDTIYVDGLGGNSSFYILCPSPMDLLATFTSSSLRISGYNGRPNIGCVNNTNSHIALFRRLHTNVSCRYALENINIHNGMIGMANCSVAIRGVNLTNVSVMTHAPCLHVDVDITNSFLHGGQFCPENNSCLELQTHAINCSFTNLTVDTSELYQTSIVVLANGRAGILVRNSLFSNSPSKLRALGGLHFTFSAYDSDIVITNSTFKDQIHPSKVKSAINLYEGAIWLKALRAAAQNATAVIQNCIFNNNERGIILVGPFGFLLLQNTSFTNNIAMHAGGAVLVLIHDNTQLTVDNCTFRDNVAGDYRRDYPIQEKSGEFTEVGSEVVLNAECCRGIITLVGKGGAIRLQRGQVKLNNCHFENNTAKLLGGSIFVDIDGFLVVGNSTFLNTDVHNHSLQGDIIYSDGEVAINAVEMKVITAKNGLSILRHSGDHWKMVITNVWIECPVGFNLRSTNSSAYGVFEYGLMRSHKLDQLSYFCESCPRNKYSLDHGYLNYTMKFYDFAYYTLLINGSQPEPAYNGSYAQHDIECFDCPYGGHCVQGITSVANFWGFAEYTNGSSSKKIMRFQYCPQSYCCTMPSCPSHDTCVRGRHGRLCGRCIDGLSEALFSAECIPNEQCGPLWLIPFGLGLGLIYALFLMLQVDLKNFLFSEPLLPSTCKHRHRNACNKPYMNGNGMVLAAVSDHEDAASSDNGVTCDLVTMAETAPDISSIHKPRVSECTTHEFKASDSGFLIILFYYFQDALLLNVKTVYVSNDSGAVDLMKAVLSGLFKFHLDIFKLLDQVCAVPDMTPVPKILAKALDVPYVIMVFTVVYALHRWVIFVSKSTSYPRHDESDARYSHTFTKNRSFIARLSSGFILALLFTFQKMGTTTFTLLNCVPVEGKRVLFIDGWVECYQYWQYGVFAYAITCVTPFFIVLLVGPSLLYRRNISLIQFFLACLCPLPFLFYWAAVKIKITIGKSATQQPRISSRLPETTRAVIQVLQGPFKENKYGFSWAGVLIGRRLILVLLFTFVNDSLIRLLWMLLFCFLILLHHVHAQPYKDKRGNIAGTTSAAALVTLGTLNLVRAGFEAAEYRPTGPNAFLMMIFEEIENTLLVWIPLCIMSAVALLFMVRTAVCIVACCSCAMEPATESHAQEKGVCISLHEFDK